MTALKKTRYFIYNHEAAFAACHIDGATWVGGAIRPTDGSRAATLKTPLLDSGTQGNVWPRVRVDVSLPEGASICWRFYAGDRETALDEVFTAENADDFLPFTVRGRYAMLEAELSYTAAIRSIQIFSAWESFLDYLPEIYRDYDRFPDRFLRLFTVQYLDLERRIEEMPATFDPASATEETLRWLAEIAGVPHVGLWEAEGLRKLLVSGIHKRRGQFSVFADYLAYFTGFQPYIAEHFRYRTGVAENDRLYSDGDVTVFLPPEAATAALDLDALDLVITDFLPEDVIWRVIILQVYPLVSDYAFLGVNTRMGAYEEMVVGKSRIGFSVVGGAE